MIEIKWTKTTSGTLTEGAANEGKRMRKGKTYHSKKEGLDKRKIIYSISFFKKKKKKKTSDRLQSSIICYI